MLPQFYWTLLFAILFYALVRGGTEHKIAAIGCVVATFATRLMKAPFSTRYYDLEVGVLAVDVSLFALFLAIALRSQRFWPLWIAGFHLVTVLAHILRALKVDLIPSAYALAVQFWSYPVLFCIGIAIWRSQRRKIATLPVPGSDHIQPPTATA